MDNNMIPLDTRTNVSKFANSGDGKSYGKDIKKEITAEIISELFLSNITMFRLCEFLSNKRTIRTRCSYLAHMESIESIS